MDELNQGLTVLQRELLSDETAAQRVQLAIIQVGGVADDAALVMDWTDAVAFQPPQLVAAGNTPLAKGLRLALQAVASHKLTLQRNGITYTRPWVMVMSDGAPTDPEGEWNSVVQECLAAEANKRCVIFPIGVADADLGKLQQLSTQKVLQLSEAKFKECFQVLSSSISTFSRAGPGPSSQQAARDPWEMFRS